MIKNKIQYLIIAFIQILVVFDSTAQTDVGLVAYYSFDNCDATDDTGNGADGAISGSPICDCGVVNNALVLDGNNDFIEFLGDFNVIFGDDFTISMFIRSTETTANIYDLLSKRSDCALDSAFSVRLTNGANRLFTELTQNATLNTFANVDMDPRKCWQHVAVVRQIGETRIYYNGVPVLSEFEDIQLDISNNGVFSIANSPCLANGESRFAGAIDELRMYNRALTTEEVFDLFRPMDEIPVLSTIIFKGNSFNPNIAQTCATGINWTPGFPVSDPNILNPDLVPEETTTFEVNFEYDGCVAMDTILLTVVDSAEFSCENVFLPNAFTPNGDDLNETFGISNVVFLGDFESFEIFDRNGARVFSGQNADEQWDGTYNGERALPGMYIYKLRFQCSGEDRFKNGSLTLIR